MAVCIKNLLLALLVFCGNPVSAMSWQDWWLTPDQQGQKAMREHDYKAAASHFRDPMWSGSAAYRAGDYKTAAQKFAQVATAEGYYNLGNALANQERLQEAIQAYDKALKIDPKHQDALFNKTLLIKRLQQEQSKQDKKSSENSSSNNASSKSENQTEENKSQDTSTKEKPQEDYGQSAKQQDKAAQKKDSSSNSDNSDAAPDPKKMSSQTNGETQKFQAKNRKQARTKKLEEQHAKQQWLQLVPDEPGGLMREKFLREHLRRQRSFE